MLTGVSMPKPLVICDNLVKIYKVADLEVVALQGLDLEVMPGEMRNSPTITDWLARGNT